MIIVKDLSYKNILDNINLELPKTVNYIKGENGAGKSTLLDCISNLNKGYSGEIKGNESIIYLNQNLYFYYRLPSKDFVEFILTLAGIKDYKTTFYDFVSKFSSVDQIDKIWKKPVGMLSGGERKRLFFSAISCIDREWYIYDEPFAGVDEKGKEFMVKVLTHFQENDKGIIITSHETDPFNVLEDMNVVKIEDGAIVG